MEKQAKIFVAGHRGMVGGAIVNRLSELGYENLIVRTRQELNLLDQHSVEQFFLKEKPDYVFMAAAKVGGIMANNTFRADFLYENVTLTTNVIHSAYEAGCKKLLFLGSSCIYPKFAAQPIQEDSLLTGELEPTNEPYALAKIMGIKLCETYRDQYGCDFISVMPTNLYGKGDNYNLKTSHVLPALIRKFHEARAEGKPQVELWGSGSPKREFLNAQDLADACIYIMNNYSDRARVNVGVGEDLSIKELAEMVRDIVGYEGNIVWDISKPDGTPRKVLDVKRLHAMGWKNKIGLREGIQMTYEDFLENIDSYSI
ncbi:GDP-L-fucose synthase family protein [Roseivirga misakiensis]|uniref:GDP-L-fucose synthase n=1 Tax=Roseivirga misakiensis TaxID=1563681 RepID=A0A1E5T5W4_9BACT|nr:GDP-L-fucose synthase [Roseivirga misakiensis]OEK06784.1 GDP-fucose synthetase [Roseivirga misakiensis]